MQRLVDKLMFGHSGRVTANPEVIPICLQSLIFGNFVQPEAVQAVKLPQTIAPGTTVLA
jgi:hypothetical protein